MKILLKVKENIANTDIPLDVWSIFALIFLTPLVPNIISPFIVLIPFIITICSKKHGSKRRKDLINLFKTKNMMTMLVCLDILIIFIGIIPAENKIYAFFMSLMWSACLLAFLAIMVDLKTKTHIKMCIGALVLSGVVSAIIAIIQYLFNLIGVGFPNPLWGGFEKAILDIVPVLQFNFAPDEYVRAYSTFLNTGVYGYFLVFMAPFAFYFFTLMTTKKGKIFAASGILIITIALAFTFSRISYGAFLVSVIFIALALAYLNFREKRKIIDDYSILPLISIFFIIPLAIFALYFILPDSVIARFDSIFVIDNSKAVRFKLWESSVEMFTKKPIFGYGTGLENQWSIFRNVYSIPEPHAHNLFLQIVLEGGLFRAIPFLAAMVLFFKQAVVLIKVKSVETKRLGICFIGSMGAFLISGATDFQFVDPKMCCLYFVILALCNNAVFQLDEKDKIYIKERKELRQTLRKEKRIHRIEKLRNSRLFSQ